MASTVDIPAPMRDLLHAAMLDENDLVAFLRKGPLVEMADKPDHARCTGTLPVRRALDPETSEMRPVEVVLRRSAEGRWQVVAISGLDMPELA
ncbi:MAG: hypothetical protein ACM3OB_09705 [Acidobacteriota bacterium]